MGACILAKSICVDSTHIVEAFQNEAWAYIKGGTPPIILRGNTPQNAARSLNDPEPINGQHWDNRASLKGAGRAGR